MLMFSLLVTVCFQTSYASSSTILKSGMQNVSVTMLQKDLKTLGFFTASAISYFGSATKSAVIAFQKHCGLTADGVAGPQTLSKITNLLSRSTTIKTPFTATNSSTNSKVECKTHQ